MTGAPSAVRVGDLPRQQAAFLLRIHQLAAAGTALRQNMRATHDPADRTQLLDELGQIDRQRELTEIQARSNAVPAPWVTQAREAGRTGRAWSDDNQLRVLPHHPGRRRSSTRVAEDIRQLTDMAVTLVVGDHRLIPSGHDTAALHTAAAHQLRRNMDALWTRAVRTAAAIGMSRKERNRAFSISDDRIKHRVDHFLTSHLDDIESRWRTYIDPTIAASVRRSLMNLRRSERETPPPRPEHDATLPPTSTALIERARAALNELTHQPATGRAIDTAITAALPDQTHTHSPTDTDVEAIDHLMDWPFPDTGPGP